MRKRKDPTPQSPYVTFATALNYYDPDQRMMIEHIQKRTNASDYIKRLVLRDMQGITYAPAPHVAILDEDEAPELDLGLISGIL